MLEDQLKNLGLSEGEAKVYLASLELGSDTVMHLAQKAGIKRPTCYVMIESLMKKGLMSSFTKGKKRYFSSEHPERILDMILSEKTEIIDKERRSENLLPELVSLFNLAEKKPRVRFFEGKEGIRAIQKDILKSKAKTAEEFIPLDPGYKLFPPSAGDHRQKMKRKFKSRRAIYTSRSGLTLPMKEKGIERIFIPFKKFPFSTEVTIYGDKVAFSSLEETVLGVIIESKEIADTLRAIFNLSWGAAKKYEK